MGFLLFFFIILFVPLLTIRKRNNEDIDILNSFETTCLKGVLCLFVMFHNLGLDYYHNLGINSGIFDIVAEHSGGIAVGLFFFLSAFGILRSYQKHGNKYLLRLLFVHIPKIYFVSVAINTLIYFTFFRGTLEIKDLVLRILNLDLFNNFNRMNRHGWYIASIIALYLLFIIIYYIFSKIKIKKNIQISSIVLAALVIGIKILSMIVGKGGMYVREITLFSTGILYACYFEQINGLIKKYYWLIFSISLISMIIGFFFYEGLAAQAAALFIITCANKITWKNKITFVLGKICLGVYLHLYFSTLVLQSFINNPYYWMLSNAGMILLLSFITYGIVWGIEWIIRKILTPKSPCNQINT